MASEAMIVDEAPMPVEAATYDRSYDWLILSMSAAVVLLAFLLKVRPDQRVEFGFLPSLPIPELCQSRALLGIDCPGCGLTRSFIHLAHGNFQASTAVNRVGWLLAVFVALQIPYRLWVLRHFGRRPLGDRAPWIILWSIMALLFANWIAKLIA